jgi:hypothetical protein
LNSPYFGSNSTKIETSIGSTTSKAQRVELTAAKSSIVVQSGEVESTASEIDSIAQILSREEVRNLLMSLEKKYGTSSEHFYRQWLNGNALGGKDTLKWVALWEAWREQYLIR